MRRELKDRTNHTSSNMIQADYRGARGANAGDDFHELWALRQALALLDRDAGLMAVAVEGLRAEDESGTPQDTWDGVDCTFYFGGDQAALAERIVLDQLKYSAANSDHPWTIARLTQSSNKKKDNSVVGRLAKAFAGLKGKRPDLVSSGNVVVRLVSNQQVDPAVLDALYKQQTPSNKSLNRPSRQQSDRATLLAASGLQEGDFEAFVSSLDLSECGSGSRFALEERILITISDWTDDDARTAINDLMRFVRRAMLPETKREFITRESILARLGFSDPRALFPCPSVIGRVERLIPRKASQILTEEMLRGDQRICLHGEGGCGKTTALQEIESLLPQGSVVIVFDCYGGGRYLDSDAYRHRPQDAFLQLSNDLARQLRTPLLVTRSPHIDYPRVFKKRLGKAADVVASQTRDALLVIIVDAADNSVTAASTHSPPDRSFVHDFMTLGELPGNARLVVTARTGRLSTLNLPHSFSLHEITGFSPEETATHVRAAWRDAPDVWIEDFHHLSGGNPRVQRYALDYAGAEPKRALNYLRPTGKGLDQVFREQIEHARHKVGRDQEIKSFCSGLIALPRPIPVAELSDVIGLSEAHISDLCADLAPGVRLKDGLIGFADEDFEHFVRTEGQAQLPLIQTRIADRFLSRHRSDAYAAAHVAAALLVAGRRREIIDLINTDPEPAVIGDPVLRREAQLRRLRIAMKVCRDTGNNVDAMLTLLRGADALKTDSVIRRMLIENPDLAANFARDSAGRIVLRDPDAIESHGPMLFHLMEVDARYGNGISVREGHRQVQAWLQRRAEDFGEQKRKHPGSSPHGWSIDDHDIAAEIEAVLRIAGPEPAVDALLRWRPKSVMLRVASILSLKLIISGEEDLIQRCLTETGISTPWDLFLLTPLALAGKEVDLSRLESGVDNLLRRRLIRVNKLRDTWSNDKATAEYLDMILTACEIIVARGGNLACVVPVLERMADREARQRDRLFTSQVALIDITLRAHVLLERLAGRQATLETYWVDPPEPIGELPPKQVEQLKRSDGEKKKELRESIGPLVEVYDVRAQALVGSIVLEEVNILLRKAIARSNDDDYRYYRKHYATAMIARAALSLTRLMALSSLDRAVLYECVSKLLGPRSGSLGEAEAEIFASLALDRSLHQQILSVITSRARTVRDMRTSADDKIAALISFALLLLPISYGDAESLFNEAVEVASEINTEAIHQIALFAPLVEHAVGSMDFDKRRAAALNLATVVSDAGIRITGQDYFPWEEAAKAITALDVCLALAAAGRWEDSSVVGRTTFLPPILEMALSRHELSPTQVSALSPLFDRLSVEVIDRIIEEAKEQRSGLNLNILREYLAQEELLRFGQGRRPEVSEKLISLPVSDGFWLDQLQRATKFHKDEKLRQAALPGEEGHSRGRAEVAMERPDPLGSFDWPARSFVSTEEIDEVIRGAITFARASDAFISASAVLDRLGSVIALGDRISHLEALSRYRSPQLSDDELAEIIAKRIEGWHESPSVKRWCRERLIQVVVDLLPGFSRWLTIGRSPLPALLEKSGVSNHQICEALLDGMERHVDTLGAATIYALVGLVGRHCAPDETAQAIERYADRLVKRIPIHERDNWDLTDIPIDVAGGLARLLYALLGDVDLRIRWRAAHAIRNLARLGDTATLDKLVELYGRTSEPSFRKSDAPFYWLAARLWLVITLDRIASETPSAVGRHGLWLLELATDQEFPHVIVRSFAKSAVRKLVESGDLVLDRAQRGALERANTSPLRRKKGRQDYSVSFDKYGYTGREDRRFHFDSMDTLPYWYTRAVQAFADVGQEEFLDAAERWIVDRWGVKDNPWKWEDEPRKQRLSDSGMDHRHGSLPTQERFHTHLEWHAMWCATGELMRSRALARTEEDSYYGFESWLRGEGLTSPPLWLVDLRGMKPLEVRLWFWPQGDREAWVNNVDDDDFLAELRVSTDKEMIVVGSYHDTRSSGFMSSVRVNTALVSPDTGGALVRAFQTVDYSWDYTIPLEGADDEIEAPPFRLVGWLANERHDLGIDEGDPLRYEVRAIERTPSIKTAKALNIEFAYDAQARWVEINGRNTVFVFEVWGDNSGDERYERLRYDEAVRSSGWRLLIDREALRTFLNEMRLDLIVEIEITRRNKGYEYSQHDEEKTKETRFDRVVLLRRDGTIEAAERCLGTWTPPRP